jgi:hypothetical protein
LIDLFDEKECLVGFCLKHNIKLLFNNTLINNNVDKVFRTTVGCNDAGYPISVFASPRMCPWFLCFIDASSSRILYLIFIGLVLY